MRGWSVSPVLLDGRGFQAARGSVETEEGECRVERRVF